MSKRLFASSLLTWILLIFAMAAPLVADGPEGPGGESCPGSLVVQGFTNPLENDVVPVSMAPYGVGRFFDEERQQYLPLQIVLFMADAGRHAIWITGEQETLMAGTPGVPGFVDGYAAQFNNPSGLAVDEEGMAYVADRGNHAIRRVHPDGWVETIAGGPEMGLFQNPTGVAYWSSADGERALVVADTGNHCLWQIDLNDPEYAVYAIAGSCGEAGSRDGAGGEALFEEPRSIDAWDGNIFVTDRSGIRRLRNRGDELTVSTILSRPGVESVFADEQSSLYITTQGSPLVEWIRILREEYVQPVPLTPCGGAIRSPRATATFFGKLIVADGSLLRTISAEAEPDGGVKRDCPRCGPRIPIHE